MSRFEGVQILILPCEHDRLATSRPIGCPLPVDHVRSVAHDRTDLARGFVEPFALCLEIVYVEQCGEDD